MNAILTASASASQLILSVAGRRVIRDAAGFSSIGHHYPVVLVDGSSSPALVGSGAEYYTDASMTTRVWHPGAYARKCFRPLYRVPVSRRIEVGRDWRPSVQIAA